MIMFLPLSFYCYRLEEVSRIELKVCCILRPLRAQSMYQGQEDEGAPWGTSEA